MCDVCKSFYVRLDSLLVEHAEAFLAKHRAEAADKPAIVREALEHCSPEAAKAAVTMMTLRHLCHELIEANPVEAGLQINVVIRDVQRDLDDALQATIFGEAQEKAPAPEVPFNPLADALRRALGGQQPKAH